MRAVNTYARVNLSVGYLPIYIRETVEIYNYSPQSDGSSNDISHESIIRTSSDEENIGKIKRLRASTFYFLPPFFFYRRRRRQRCSAYPTVTVAATSEKHILLHALPLASFAPAHSRYYYYIIHCLFFYYYSSGRTG